uniref:Peptide chain release factor 1 n=1 Tax=Echinococcus granulosus TaxID=6210 RepID=A0A068X0V0_ECHGR|nr:peptide chain release factor 1 [Echinococcus granulosus]
MRRFLTRRPLAPLNRLIICGSHILNQEGGTQSGLSSALQRFVNKNNDFLFNEYERLSKLVSSGRTGEIKENLDKWSKIKLLMDLSQRLQTLATLDADSARLLQELVDGSDTTLQELAAQEFTSRREEIRSLENRIMELLLPPDPTAQYSAVRLQLIAGAGGLEAAMFARDLFTMYAAYARYCGWQFASDDDGGATGAAVGADSPIHHVEVRVESSDPVDPVYPRLRWEAGVHRVQRVPLTSKLNKIHTSTVAVTILPVIDEAEVELDPEDLEWEVFRASGAGGQHVNKTESAVRVRHRPTGHVAACQADRSQHTNREAALKALRAKIANEAARRQVETEQAERRSQMGLLARSDRIRTYNYQQDRITDHRLGRSWSGLATFMRQGFPVLDETALALDEAYKLNALASLDKPYFLC